MSNQEDADVSDCAAIQRWMRTPTEALSLSEQEIENLSLADRNIAGHIVFRKCNFGRLFLKNLLVSKSVRFENCLFRSEVFVENTKISGETLFVGCQFCGDVHFGGTSFDDIAAFEESEFHRYASFRDCNFSEYAIFRKAQFISHFFH